MRVGYDVEAFINVGAGLAAASEFLGGSKEAPISVDGHNIHPDNIMAEFSSSTPIEVDDLLHHLNEGTKKIRDMLPEGAEIMYAGSVDAAVLDGHPSMNDLGCLPDKVYGHDRSIGPADLGTTRCAGFHLHFDTEMPPLVAVSICDAVLGLTAAVLGEDQGSRKDFYGKAGSHRSKPYGIEYRMLSADFVNLLTTNQAIVMAAIKLAARLLASPEAVPELVQISIGEGGKISEAINTGNTGRARELWENHVYPHLEAIQ